MVTYAKENHSQTSKEQSLVLWFSEVGIADIGLVGGKNASLGEMIQQLAPHGVNKTLNITQQYSRLGDRIIFGRKPLYL